VNAFVLLKACVMVAALAAATAHAHDIEIPTPDGPRTAIVLPAGQGPRPTVILLHGAAGTAEMVARDSGFGEAAAKVGFTAVFPQGLHRRWHDERAGGFDGPDDVAFLRALVARLTEDRIASPAHVYIAGISNGGIMSFTMACKAGNLFRGVGTIIATMPVGIGPCNLPPMPLVMVNGTADPLVPYDGGNVGWLGGRGAVWSVRQSSELFIRINGCNASAERRLSHVDHDDATRVTEITWKDCSRGKPVILYRIEGGGHQVPGAPTFLSFLLGRVTTDMSAADAIMSAFAREDASAGAQ
jgi:polyhydroxybutyrate depolymerase